MNETLQTDPRILMLWHLHACIGPDGLPTFPRQLRIHQWCSACRCGSKQEQASSGEKNFSCTKVHEVVIPSCTGESRNRRCRYTREEPVSGSQGRQARTTHAPKKVGLGAMSCKEYGFDACSACLSC